MGEMAEREASLGGIARELWEDGKKLLRREARMIRREAAHDAKDAAKAGVLAGAGGVLAVAGLSAMAVAAGMMLSRRPQRGAALAGLALLGVGAGFAFAALRKAPTGLPRRLGENVRADVDAVKSAME